MGSGGREGGIYSLIVLGPRFIFLCVSEAQGSRESTSDLECIRCPVNWRTLNEPKDAVECRAYGMEVNVRNGGRKSGHGTEIERESSGAAADGDSCPGGDFTTVIITG